jgi:hypothetical protein
MDGHNHTVDYTNATPTIKQGNRTVASGTFPFSSRFFVSTSPSEKLNFSDGRSED